MPVYTGKDSKGCFAHGYTGSKSIADGLDILKSLYKHK